MHSPGQTIMQERPERGAGGGQWGQGGSICNTFNIKDKLLKNKNENIKNKF